MTRITQQQLESCLRRAAALCRGTIDAGDFQQFIFLLLFYKRLCDVFDEETCELAQSFLADEHIQRVVRAHQEFKDEPGFGCVASVEQVSANGVNLGILLYIKQVSLATESANTNKGDLNEAPSSWLGGTFDVHKTLRALGGTLSA